VSPTFSHVIACPKCGRSRADGAEACPRCGLVFANWTPGSKLDHPAVADATTPLDADGLRLWDALVGNWADDAGHDAFLKHCATAGCLAAAGRQYRKRLDAYPQDEVAGRMQARIVGMVAATLAPTRAAGLPVSRSRWFWWVVMVCGVGGAAAGMFLHRLGR
jgi:hypothetical protein